MCARASLLSYSLCWVYVLSWLSGLIWLPSALGGVGIIFLIVSLVGCLTLGAALYSYYTMVQSVLQCVPLS